MSERIAEVYSLLIPLADARLLVPRACVAEVVGYHLPAPMESAPPWYLGLLNWNARPVPLVSFEGACGQPIPPFPAAGARQQRCGPARQLAQFSRPRAGAVSGTHAQRDPVITRPRASRAHDRGGDLGLAGARRRLKAT